MIGHQKLCPEQKGPSGCAKVFTVGDGLNSKTGSPRRHNGSVQVITIQAATRGILDSGMFPGAIHLCTQPPEQKLAFSNNRSR